MNNRKTKYRNKNRRNKTKRRRNKIVYYGGDPKPYHKITSKFSTYPRFFDLFGNKADLKKLNIISYDPINKYYTVNEHAWETYRDEFMTQLDAANNAQPGLMNELMGIYTVPEIIYDNNNYWEDTKANAENALATLVFSKRPFTPSYQHDFNDIFNKSQKKPLHKVSVNSMHHI
jgi:hypothetical protein